MDWRWPSIHKLGPSAQAEPHRQPLRETHASRAWLRRNAWIRGRFWAFPREKQELPMQRTMEVGVDMPVKWMVEDWNGGMLEYGNAGARESLAELW